MNVPLQAGMPASLDSERSVLGAILLDNAAYNHAAELLTPADFSHDGHRRIFARMIELAESGRPIDPVTLTQELLRVNELEAAGGVSYFTILTEGLPRSVNTRHYAKIVADLSTQRRLIHTSNGIMRQAIEGGDLGELLDSAEAAILAVGEHRAQSGPLSFAQSLRADFSSIEEMVQPRAGLSGLPTGFTRFDDLTCGLQPQELIIVAARPSMGKTAWALSVALNVALRGETVLLFSLEMSRQAIVNRLACAAAHVDSHKFRSGFLQREEQQRLVKALGQLSDSPIFIDDTSALRLQELHAKARRIKSHHGLALVIVDYLGLMTPPKAENRTQQVSELARGLKKQAKDLGVPMMVLSQLSRAPERRGAGEEGHKPQLADLRDSGEIEQTADLVAFLYRDEYYYRTSGREVPPEVEGRAEIIIAKQRNGPLGSVPMAFLDRFARFDNMAEGF